MGRAPRRLENSKLTTGMHIYPLRRTPARYQIDLECRAHGFYTLRLLQCALWLCVLPAARPPDALWAAPHAV